MNKGKKLYEGKAKIIYETKDKDLIIQHFKDDATAFNNLKKANVEGKGVLNNRISEHILNNLNQCNIKTHLVKRYSEIRLFKTPFPSTLVFFKLLKAVASSLKCCITKSLSFVS